MKPVLQLNISCMLYQQVESVCGCTEPGTSEQGVLNCLLALVLGAARIPFIFLTVHQLCQRTNLAFKHA